jgi:glycosyltransferase involved in cell wall biosynthesis
MFKYNNPPVTICIPTHNSEITIYKSLKSILCQTYKNIKIKILDNASTDKTIKIIKSFRDKRIKIYKFKKKVSAEENFNRCIRVADGKYTAIYHSDDLYNKDIVSMQVCFLEKNKNTGVVFTEGDLVNANFEKISSIKSPLKKKNDNFNYDKNIILKFLVKDYNFFLCPTAMVRTNIYKSEIKNFRHKLFKNSSDLDCWLRILKNSYIGVIKKNLISYRISKSQQTFQTRDFSKLPFFFKVMDTHLEQFKFFKNNNDYIKDYYILKNYIKLFIIIGYLKINNLTYSDKFFHKFKLYYAAKKKLSLSKKEYIIYIILNVLKITRNLKILNKFFINFLYYKFYKV